MGPRTGICLNHSPSSEWPLCCTRPKPPTAMDLWVRSMHPWRRGMDTRCPWETPASGLPLCMCWEISFRALGSWLPLSSSTSRYCNGVCLSLPPYLHPLSSWYPMPPSSTSPSSFPASPSFGVCLLSPLQDSQGAFRLFAKMALEPPLSHHCFFISPASVQGG